MKKKKKEPIDRRVRLKESIVLDQVQKFLNMQTTFYDLKLAYADYECAKEKAAIK